MTKKNRLQTDIFNYHTPEFFINMKSIPDKSSSERAAFVLEEKKKSREGINVNGVRIPGGLYFHLNFYKLSKDVQGSQNKKEISLPDLRDNEWIVFNDYDSLSAIPKIYTLFGLRQCGKSEIEVSLCLRELSLYKNTEALSLFSSDTDKDTFVKKIRIAIEYGEKFIIVPNIDKSWDKSEIRFGFTKQDNSIELRGTLYIYNTQEGKKIQVGSGKALKHGSKVYYEDRVNNIEDCKIGDKIYGRDGNLTTVIGVYPQGIVDLYEIEFFDGRKVVCSGDHLWTIQNTENHRQRIETLNTEYLFKTFKRKYFNKKLNKEIEVNRYTIPNIESLNFGKKNVLIDPYYLGLWLGDGTTNSPNHVTTVDEEIVKFLEKYAITLGGRLVQNDGITYKICNLLDNYQTPLKRGYQYYDLKHNKHIPKDYLYNSIDNRMELLKGLMDSDGYVDKNGRISLSLSDEILHKDVLFLIRSLGINCTVTTKKTSYYSEKYNKRVKGKLAYIIYIGTSDLPLFKLSRKFNRQVFKKRPCIGIENIKKVESDFATCIKVDNKDSLFLTNDFVPTHNTPTFLLSDEVAKAPFRTVYDAIEPALLTDFGTLRCSPIFTLTGGEVEKSKDAENLIKYPSESKQFITTLDTGQVVGGRFLDGTFRKDCKKKIKLSEYLGSSTNTWLDDYPISISDREVAISLIDKEVKEAEKSPDPKTAILKKIFFPRSLNDVFLSESNNRFPIEACRAHKDYLEQEWKPECVQFHRDKSNKVVKSSSDLKPLNKFPIKQSDNKIAPVCMYEPPISGLPLGTYVMGIDPINEDSSSDKEVSMGSFYVKKRMYNPLGEFQNQMVCSFCGRFDNLKQFHQLCLDVAEFYNALVLPENEEKTLIQFFINKKKDYLLFESFDLAKRINPLSKSSRVYGLSAATPNQRYGMTLLVEEANDEIFIDENTPILGVTRILDPMLIEEYISYRGKPKGSKGVHDGNYDRIIAWYLTNILAAHLDNVMPLSNIRIQKEDDNKDKPIHKEIQSPWFTMNKTPSTSTRKSSSPFLSFRK